jgi:hypothetical protein
MLELTDRHVAGRTMTDLADVYARHGSLQAAMACYERALAAFRDVGDTDAEAHALCRLDALRKLAARQAAARS